MTHGSTVRVLLFFALFLFSTRLAAQQAQAAVDASPVSLVRAQSVTGLGSIPERPRLTGWEHADRQEEFSAPLSLALQPESKRPIWVLPLAGAVAGGLIAKYVNPADFGEGSCNPPTCRRNGSPVLKGAVLGTVAGLLLDSLL